MGNIESKEYIDKNILINIETYTYFIFENGQEIKNNIGKILLEKPKIVKPFISNIVKEAINSLHYACYINLENIFLEVTYKNDEILNITLKITIEGTKEITFEMIKLAIIHFIHQSKPIQIEKNIFLKFQENDIISLTVSN